MLSFMIVMYLFIYLSRSVEEYQADIQNIVHNVVIFHGNHSHMADMAKQMFRGCSTDLNELLTCKDCFRYVIFSSVASYSITRERSYGNIQYVFL